MEPRHLQHGMTSRVRIARCRPRFTPFRARWIRQPLWHPAREIRGRPDRSLGLRLPVVDVREVRMTIQQFGADVEVLEPEALRQAVAREIAAMTALYKGLQGSDLGDGLSLAVHRQVQYFGGHGKLIVGGVKGGVLFQGQSQKQCVVGRELLLRG